MSNENVSVSMKTMSLIDKDGVVHNFSVEDHGARVYFGAGEMPEGCHMQMDPTKEEGHNKLHYMTADVSEKSKQQIVEEVMAMLKTPVFASIDENNIITLEGKLSPGTYSFKYEMADGTLVDIGQVEVS